MRILKLSFAGLVAVAGTASAQSTDPNVPDPTVPTPTTPAPTPSPPSATREVPMTAVATTNEPWTLRRIGLGLTAGGGVEGFTDGTMRDTTTAGGNWFVRATLGTKQVIGVEAAYFGSAQAIDALGLDPDAVLIGNGVQGNVRINATTDSEIQPFLYGGVAWRRYDITNSSRNTSDINDKDDVLELPVGIGLAYKHQGFMLDARGEFRGAFYEDLVPTGGTTAADLHRWGFNANLGYEF